jgi:hypothetical protein
MSEGREVHPGTRDGVCAKSMASDDSLVTEAVLVAAIDVIRDEGDGCVVDLTTLLEGLSDKFDRFLVTPDVSELLVLIRTLWDNPHIDQPQRGLFEFAWNERGSVSCVGYCCDPEPPGAAPRISDHRDAE